MTASVYIPFEQLHGDTINLGVTSNSIL